MATPTAVIRKILKKDLVKLSPSNDIVLSITDTGELFVNAKNGDQLPISDIIPIEDDVALANTIPIKDKWYFIKNSQEIGEFDIKIYLGTTIGWVSIKKPMLDEISKLRNDFAITKYHGIFTIQNFQIGKVPSEVYLPAYIFNANEKVSLKSVSIKSKTPTNDPITIELRTLIGSTETVVGTVTLLHDAVSANYVIPGTTKYTDGYLRAYIISAGANTPSEILVVVNMEVAVPK